MSVVSLEEMRREILFLVKKFSSKIPRDIISEKKIDYFKKGILGNLNRGEKNFRLDKIQLKL
jgi:hypothetical protein